MTTQEIAYLKILAPPDPDWRGTGSLKLHPDPRDYDLRSFPGVQAQLAAGVPDTFDLTPLVKGAIYDQGATPACVAFSTAGLNSMDDVAENARWETFDAAAMYRAAGGTGQNGVDTRLVLQQATDTGVPILGGNGRVKLIGSYAFVPQQPGVFRQTIKAAIAAGQPCTLALLLPSNWGWDSSGSPTSGYHQVVGIAYDATWLTILNSWGSGWGRNGMGRVPWDYLEANSLQNGYCYSYSTTQLKIEPQPQPQPQPQPTGVIIGGKVTGANLSSVVVGEGYQLSGQGLTWPFTITQVNGPKPDPQPQPQPQPQPGTLTVTLTAAGIWSQVRLADPATGGYLSGMVSATLSDRPYPVARPRTTAVGGQVIPALIRRPVQGAIITGKSDDGRTGTAVVT